MTLADLETVYRGARPPAWLPDLLGLLVRILPDGWHAAAESGELPERLAGIGRAERRAIVSELGRDGWLTPHWAPAHGGRGLSPEAAVGIVELLDRWGIPRLTAGAGIQLAAPAILEWASDETKLRLLPRIASGEELWCQLFSEPGAGSDLASLATTAVRNGEGWVINGQKVWTTQGHRTQFGMLLARTDPSLPKHQGITYFGVDMRSEGVDIRPLVNIAGEVEFNEVFLTDVYVPDLYRISPVGSGWGAALTTLGAERQTLAGGGVKRRAKDEIIGGKTIGEVIDLARSVGATDDAVWRQRLATEWIKQRLLALSAQRSHSGSSVHGSLRKLAKASANQSLQVLAIDLLGAEASASNAEGTQDYVRQFLRTRANSIEGGTSEIQRNIVGERVLGLPREPDPFHGMGWRDVPRSGSSR